jgi:hypothetical protein
LKTENERRKREDQSNAAGCCQNNAGAADQILAEINGRTNYAPEPVENTVLFDGFRQKQDPFSAPI